MHVHYLDVLYYWISARLEYCVTEYPTLPNITWLAFNVVTRCYCRCKQIPTKREPRTFTMLSPFTQAFSIHTQFTLILHNNSSIERLIKHCWQQWTATRPIRIIIKFDEFLFRWNRKKLWRANQEAALLHILQVLKMQDSKFTCTLRFLVSLFLWANMSVTCHWQTAGMWPWKSFST